MAWQARVANAVTPADRTIRVEMHYFDDATPAEVLHQKVFLFKMGLTNLQIRAEIVKEGQLVRAVHVRAANIAAANPVGTTIAIP